MLKKLLASALAVATVASCAYVPTALASAATTYKTANEIEYDAYKLLNPDGPSSNIDVTIYVSSNKSDITGTYTKNIAPENNNVSYLKENLAGAKKGDDELTLNNVNEVDKITTRRVVTYLVASDQANVYVANVAVQAAVEYSAINPNAFYEADADKMAAQHAAVLGWYDLTLVGDSYQVDTQTVLADMYAGSYASEAKVANSVFNAWKYDPTSFIVLPSFTNVESMDESYVQVYYKEVTLYRVSASGSESNLFAPSQLTSGSYYTSNDSRIYVMKDLYLPKNDTANWNKYLVNYAYVEDKYAPSDVKANNDVTYTPSGVRAVKDGVYALTYKAVAGSSTGITYSLKLVTDKNDVTEVAAITEVQTSSKTYTTDPETIYSILKAAGAKATVGTDSIALSSDSLAEFLKIVAGKDDSTDKYLTQYESTNTLTELKQDTTAGTVSVTLRVIPKYLANVYSFGNGTVEKTETYLTADQLAETTYSLLGVSGTAMKDEKVIKATRDALGVAENAVIDGVPAQYAYAQCADEENNYGSAILTVETTYILGEATASKADFQTATGAFQVKPYFCRDNAYVGDKVMLKVALTESGIAKGLDITKVTVKYDLVGATAGANYHFVPAAGDTRPEGIATDITLVEGTNIAVAKVYYDGALVATFDPFYTVAIAK